MKANCAYSFIRKFCAIIYLHTNSRISKWWTRMCILWFTRFGSHSHQTTSIRCGGRRAHFIAAFIDRISIASLTSFCRGHVIISRNATIATQEGCTYATIHALFTFLAIPKLISEAKWLVCLSISKTSNSN